LPFTRTARVPLVTIKIDSTWDACPIRTTPALIPILPVIPCIAALLDYF
jgi:hypothetical protein